MLVVETNQDVRKSTDAGVEGFMPQGLKTKGKSLVSWADRREVDLGGSAGFQKSTDLGV